MNDIIELVDKYYFIETQSLDATPSLKYAIHSDGRNTLGWQESPEKAAEIWFEYTNRINYSGTLSYHPHFNLINSQGKIMRALSPNQQDIQRFETELKTRMEISKGKR